MFIGHFAPAFIAAAVSPDRPRLGTMFVAAQLIDWGFFTLALVGIEAMRIDPEASVMVPFDLYHMPYTHSLLGSAVFAAAFGALVLGLTKSRAAGGLAALVVLSHWFLDLLVHAPDLTLAGSPPKLGLALWNYPTIEMPLELGLTFGALWLYVRRKRPAPLRVGVLAAVLLALQAVNWFGPVEPEVTTGTSLLAFFAYGTATLAAWWMGKSAANSARTG